MRRPQADGSKERKPENGLAAFRSRDRTKVRDRRWSAGRRRPHTNGGGGPHQPPGGADRKAPPKEVSQTSWRLPALHCPHPNPPPLAGEGNGGGKEKGKRASPAP